VDIETIKGAVVLHKIFVAFYYKRYAYRKFFESLLGPERVPRCAHDDVPFHVVESKRVLAGRTNVRNRAWLGRDAGEAAVRPPPVEVTQVEVNKGRRCPTRDNHRDCTTSCCRPRQTHTRVHQRSVLDL
jgi:hypothetical protein